MVNLSDDGWGDYPSVPPPTQPAPPQTLPAAASTSNRQGTSNFAVKKELQEDTIIEAPEGLVLRKPLTVADQYKTEKSIESHSSHDNDKPKLNPFGGQSAPPRTTRQPSTTSNRSDHNHVASSGSSANNGGLTLKGFGHGPPSAVGGIIGPCLGADIPRMAINGHVNGFSAFQTGPTAQMQTIHVAAEHEIAAAPEVKKGFGFGKNPQIVSSNHIMPNHHHPVLIRRSSICASDDRQFRELSEDGYSSDGLTGFETATNKRADPTGTKPRSQTIVSSSSDAGSHNMPIVVPGGLGFGKPSTAVGLAAHLATQGKKAAAGGPPAVSYIPLKAKMDDLWNETIKPGPRFEEFFNAPTDITKGGLQGVHGFTREQAYLKSFDDLHLTETVRNNIITRCEYQRPTPVQQCTAQGIMNGEDMLVCAQTGCGKTAAFLLPIFSTLLKLVDLASPKERACSPRCIVVTPTRELAMQIYKEGRKFSYSTALEVKCIYGGTSVAYQKKDIMERTTVLVSTTGRLLHFLYDGTICLDRLRYLVIDEADRMLDMGFGPDIEKLMAHDTMPKNRQTMMFSATFPTAVQKIAQDHLKPDYSMVTVDKIGSANKCISQHVIDCARNEKKNLLFSLLDIDLQTYTADSEADVFKKKTLIFVAKKTFADALGVMLCEANIPSTTIHSDRDQAQREEAIRDFQFGRKAVLIATGVAERGLDITGVDHVINYDLPNDIDTYIHRIGRTGRIGNPGRATSFFSDFDNKLAEELVCVLEDAKQDVPPFLRMIESAQANPFPASSLDESW